MLDTFSSAPPLSLCLCVCLSVCVSLSLSLSLPLSLPPPPPHLNMYCLFSKMSCIRPPPPPTPTFLCFCFCHSPPTSIPQILCFYQMSQVCFQNTEWMCFCATSGQYNLWMVSVLVCAPPAGSKKSTHALWIGSTSPRTLMAAMCCAAWPSSPTLRCCTTQSPWPLQSRRTQSLLRTSQSTHKVPVVSLCRGCLQVK